MSSAGLHPNFKSVVPAPLQDTPNWVMWKSENRHNKPTKVPYQAVPVDGDPKARSNDSTTWADFDDAWAESLENDKYSGVGFMLVGSKFTGIDFDGIAPNRVIEPYVASILAIAGNPYAEITPSGNGVRVFLEGTKLPEGKRKFTVTEPLKYGAEIYSGAETGRYLTVTGDKIEGSGDSIPVMDEWGLELVYVLVSQILESKFKALWTNDQQFVSTVYGGDQSRADAALCAMLVPLFGRDPQKIEDAFSASEMGQRSKWTSRNDYRDRTIKNALNLPALSDGLIWKDQTDSTDSSSADESSPEMQVTFESYADIQATDQEWLWPDHIPIGALTLYVGNPDGGKSTAAIDLISRVTRGDDFPDGHHNTYPPSDCLLAEAEDDKHATVKPRLLAAGADINRVKRLHAVPTVEGGRRMLMLDRDLLRLEKAISNNPEIRLLVISPISAYLGDSVMSIDDASVRAVLTPLQEMAQRLDIAVVAIMHLNKSSDYDVIYRVSGAMGFVAVARASWLFAKEKDTDQRYMMPIKGNLAEKQKGIKYVIKSSAAPLLVYNKRHKQDVEVHPPVIGWGDITEKSADEIMKGTQVSNKRDQLPQVKEWLDALFKDYQPVSLNDYRKYKQCENFPAGTIKRAEIALGIYYDLKTQHYCRFEKKDTSDEDVDM